MNDLILQRFFSWGGNAEEILLTHSLNVGSVLYSGVPETDEELPSFSAERDINVLFLFQRLPDLNNGTFLKSTAFILEKSIWERAHRKPFKTGHPLKKEN